MQGNVPSSMNNICAKNQTASERNELSLACNKKGTMHKEEGRKDVIDVLKKL
jgi:hypothetical protein